MIFLELSTCALSTLNIKMWGSKVWYEKLDQLAVYDDCELHTVLQRPMVFVTISPLLPMGRFLIYWYVLPRGMKTWVLFSLNKQMLLLCCIKIPTLVRFSSNVSKLTSITSVVSCIVVCMLVAAFLPLKVTLIRLSSNIFPIVCTTPQI